MKVIDFRERLVGLFDFGYGIATGMMIGFGLLALIVSFWFFIPMIIFGIVGKLCHEQLPLKMNEETKNQIAAEAWKKIASYYSITIADGTGIEEIKAAIEKAYEQGKDDMRWINQQLAEGSTPAAAMRKDK